MKGTIVAARHVPHGLSLTVRSLMNEHVIELHRWAGDNLRRLCRQGGDLVGEDIELDGKGWLRVGPYWMELVQSPRESTPESRWFAVL